jgi:hypothetical protein
MPKQLVYATILAAMIGACDPAFAQPEVGEDPPADSARPSVGVQRVCPGIDLALFERRFPNDVRRFGFDHAMLEPFVALWRSGRRPALPVAPERVTVYSLPDRPYLVGYQSGDCVIAFLAVERQQLWRWLRPHLGWTV